MTAIYRSSFSLITLKGSIIDEILSSQQNRPCIRITSLRSNSAAAVCKINYRTSCHACCINCVLLVKRVTSQQQTANELYTTLHFSLYSLLVCDGSSSSEIFCCYFQYNNSAILYNARSIIIAITKRFRIFEVQRKKKRF